jgi:hypothetical protein
MESTTKATGRYEWYGNSVVSAETTGHSSRQRAVEAETRRRATEEQPSGHCKVTQQTGVGAQGRWAFRLPLFLRLLVKGHCLIGAERSTVNAEVVENAGKVVLRAKTDHERFPVRDFVIQVVEGG